MRRTLYATFITVFWLAMMVSLVWRYGIPRRVESGEELQTKAVEEEWTDIEEWMRINWKEQPVGAAFLGVRKSGEEPGFRASSRAEMELSAPQGAVKISLKAVAQLDPKFHLDRFWTTAVAGPLNFDASGFVLEDRLYFQVSSSAAPPLRGYWPLEKPISLLESLRPVAARAMTLEEGAAYTLKVFDPIWFGRAGEAVIRVGKREVIQSGSEMVWATPVETELAGHVTTAWIDDNRTVLSYEMMKGLLFERIDAGSARMLYPQMRVEPPLPTFDVESFAHDLELIDLSKGQALGAALGIVMKLLGGGQ